MQGRGERAYDIYSRLLKERIICLMGPVSALPTAQAHMNGPARSRLVYSSLFPQPAVTGHACGLLLVHV